MEDQAIIMYKDLHKIPEIGLEEHQTTSYIRTFLSQINHVEILEKTNPQGIDTGLFCLIRAPSHLKTETDNYLFRCDIDALNFKE